MPKPIVVAEKAILMAEVKEHLGNLRKKEGELSFRATKTEEYLMDFVTHDRKKYDDLKKKIEELGVARLREEHIVKIVDLMPTNVADLKALLSGSLVSLSADNMKKIVSIVAESQA